MDINMPDMDGIAATEQLVAPGPDRLGRDDVGPGRGGLPPPLDARRRARVPRQAVQQRRAHRVDPPGLHPRTREGQPAGRRAARGRAAARTGRRRTPAASPARSSRVFSPKGGVGRTTLAVNLAVAAATELGKKVVLVDGSFQFGDVGVLLNLNPKNKSIADLIPELEQAGEVESIDTFVINHSAGIRVLLAPPSPGDGRADHADGHQAGHRGAAPDARPRGRRLHRRGSTTRRWRSSTRPTSS